MARRNTQSDYAALEVPLQLRWQYLQSTVPGVGTLMGPIEEALKEKFFPPLFGEEEFDSDFWKVVGRSVKHVELGILDPRLSADSAYITSKQLEGKW